MPKDILVVKRETLFNGNYFQGFMPIENKDFLETILQSYEYQPRTDELENNPNFQQIIMYVWIVNKKTKKVFAYKRAMNRSYKEARLRDKWSCGVGGHIDKEDSEDPIINAMMRELKEEVKMREYPTPKIIGFINDDRDSVGKVHFGVVAVAETEGDVHKGEDTISHGQFYSIKDLDKIFSDPKNEVESWTQISWPIVKNNLEGLWSNTLNI